MVEFNSLFYLFLFVIHERLLSTHDTLIVFQNLISFRTIHILGEIGLDSYAVNIF